MRIAKNSRILRVVAVALVAFTAAACASKKVDNTSISTLPKTTHGVKLEVAATVEDQARDEVSQSETTFTIGLDENKDAWDRTRFFFEEYLAPEGKRAPIKTKVAGATWELSNTPDPSSKYLYSVARADIPNGYRYTVRCAPLSGGTPAQAKFNAQNFARFINDGRLEVSLIQR